VRREKFGRSSSDSRIAREPEARQRSVDRDCGDVGAGIFDQREASFRRADFGDRRSHGARRIGAARNRGLRFRSSTRDRIDQNLNLARWGDRSKTIAAMSGGGPLTSHASTASRRRGGSRLRFAASARRTAETIVEQHEHSRPSAVDAVVFISSGVKIGAASAEVASARSAAFRGTHPLRKCRTIMTRQEPNVPDNADAGRTGRCHAV